MAADIGERVHFYRDRAGLSAQAVADECGRLGMPSISRTVITKLENGRREDVSTTELQVLAAALGVPAVLLLFPLGHAETVEVLPGRDVDPWAAIEWFTGDSEDPQMGTDSPIILWGEHRMWDGQIPIAWRDFQEEISASANGRVSYQARMRIAMPLRALIRIREAMLEQGMTPPPMHPETARIVADVERGGGYVQVLRKDMDELPRRHGEHREAQDGLGAESTEQGGES
jgi:transcriptional regulator with XRE-family HTH domain